MIKIPKPYDQIYTTNKPIILLTGGRGSGKSHESSYAVKRLTYEQGHKILYTRFTLDSAEISIIPEFTEKIDLDGDAKYFNVTRKDILNMFSGSEILFRGIKTSSGNQTAKLKSIHGLTTFVVDEAEEWESEDDFDKLKLSIRTKGVKNRVIIIMNPPSDSHFIYQKYIKDSHKLVKFDGVPVQISTHKDVCHIHTTYLDTKDHLSDEFLNDVSEMRKKHMKLSKENQLTSKYALKIIGRWADKKEGAILTNWKEGEFDESLPYCYGQDYGFSVDPTTLVKVAVDKREKKIYLDEKYYSKKPMSTDDIFNANITSVDKASDLIIGDSAEDRLINELRTRGMNIVGAKKGPGSVSGGLIKIQDYEIIVTSNSVNTKYELNNYIWNDKKAGIPVDSNNHIIDPVRYAFDFLTSSISLWG